MSSILLLYMLPKEMPVLQRHAAVVHGHLMQRRTWRAWQALLQQRWHKRAMHNAADQHKGFPRLAAPGAAAAASEGCPAPATPQTMLWEVEYDCSLGHLGLTKGPMSSNTSLP